MELNKELLQDESNYILFCKELHSIATELYNINSQEIDFIHEKYNLDR